ncbi:MAG: hypothetical protein ACR2HR_15920 [Euzebya sp.]
MARATVATRVTMMEIVTEGAPAPGWVQRAVVVAGGVALSGVTLLAVGVLLRR